MLTGARFIVAAIGTCAAAVFFVAANQDGRDFTQESTNAGNVGSVNQVAGADTLHNAARAIVDQSGAAFDSDAVADSLRRSMTQTQTPEAAVFSESPQP